MQSAVFAPNRRTSVRPLTLWHELLISSSGLYYTACGINLPSDLNFGTEIRDFPEHNPPPPEQHCSKCRRYYNKPQ